MKVKNINMKRVMMMALLTLLVQTVMAQSEAVQYWHHSWENVSGKYRVTNYSSLCNNYKVLDASTSLSDSRDFGVGDNPEWDNGGYKAPVITSPLASAVKPLEQKLSYYIFKIRYSL